jgi:tetratricopeptide (TPR) repeat protein
MLPSNKWRVRIMLAMVLAFGARSWSHAHLYDDPRLIWKHVLDEYPTLAMGHLNYANAIRTDDPHMAFWHYQQALIYNPYSPNSRFGLGTLYLVHDYVELGQFYTSQAMLYNNVSPFIKYQNARCRILLGDVEQGRKILEKVLVTNPNQFETIVLLAHVYLIDNRVEDAQKLADQAVEIDPADKQTLGIIGMIQARQGKFDQAKTNLLKAIMFNPKFIDGLLALGVINHQEGNVGIAKMYYQRVLDINANNTAANEKLGLLCWEQEQWQAALDHCRLAYQADTSRTLAGRRAADALGQLGRIDESLALFREIYEKGQRSPQLLNELAWTLSLKADPRSLTLAQQTAKMTDHRVALVLDTLANTYAATGDFEQAQQWATKALEIAKQSGETQLANGIESRLSLFEQQKPWTQYARNLATTVTP